MRVEYTKRFGTSYENAPVHVQRAVDQKLVFLIENLRHPSLRAKKYDETRGIWQARVNNAWRFYFLIEDDLYRLVDVMRHPK